MLDTDAFVFDTADTNVLGDGTINLANETLDMTIRPQPKKKSVLSLRSPIYLTGTFRHPSVGVNKGAVAVRAGAAVGLGILNPLAALLPTIETGPGKYSDCAQLVASVRAPAAAGAHPAAAHKSTTPKPAMRQAEGQTR